MKSILFTLAAGTSCILAGAQDFGQVLSSTPVIEQVAMPQQSCFVESNVLPEPRTGAGAAIGAITGAAVGNAIGHGGGRAVSTIIGMVGGAAIGDRLEGGGANQYQQVRRCTTHTAFENRVLHYNVVYEYAGRQYTAQLPYDPGATVQLQIAPVAMAPAAPVAIAPVTTMAPSVTTIYSSVEYVPYRAPVWVAPIIVGPGTAFIGHAPRGASHPGRWHRQPYGAAQPYAPRQHHGQASHWR
jgi:uncharacterized protein YcfJ